MKKLKKLLSVFFTIVIFLGATPLISTAGLGISSPGCVKAEALETSGKCGDNSYWDFDSETGKLTIKGVGDICVDDYDFEETFPPFAEDSSIKEVIIENGITGIGTASFAFCENLKTVTIPNSVSIIGEGAFSECTSLTTLTLNGVKSVGYGAFMCCSNLTNVIINGDNTIIEPYAFSECSGLTSATLNDVVSIGERSFCQCANLKNVAINGEKTVICEGAFAFCFDLTTVTLNGVKSIGKFAFVECNLGEVRLPDTVELIDCTAFALNFNLDYYGFAEYCYENNKEGLGSPEQTKEEIIDELVKELKSMFDKDFALLFLAPDGMDKFYSSSLRFNVDSKNKYYCNDSSGSLFTKDMKNLILGAGNLQSYVIPNTVENIGEVAFAYNCNLTDIKIPYGVKTLGQSSFEFCWNLTSVTLPNSVESIENNAFSECNGLKSIIIPQSVTYIGDTAFIMGVASKNYTIYCYENSYAHQYAVKNGLTYQIIDESSHIHSYTSSVTKEANCTEKGIMTYTCSCGDSYTADIPAKGHTWGNWITTAEPTATAEGSKERECSVCHTKETKTIDKLNTISDEETGIEIIYGNEFQDGTEIEVSKVSDDSAFELINKNYGKNINAVIYDINAIKDSVTVQPTGAVTVKIPVPEEYNGTKITVMYIDTINGTTETIPCKIVDGYIEFIASHFSEYALIWGNCQVNSVSINDIELMYKKTAVIKPEINADEGTEYTVTYTSSNPQVATVDQNGNIATNHKGDTTITCTVTDIYGNTVSDTCKVTVKLQWWQWIIWTVLFGFLWY